MPLFILPLSLRGVVGFLRRRFLLSPPFLLPPSTEHNPRLPAPPIPPPAKPIRFFPASPDHTSTRVRQEVLCGISITSILTISRTHHTRRTNIQTNGDIADTIFNSVHNLLTERRSPRVPRLLFADPYLHPFFPKAISETDDCGDDQSVDLPPVEHLPWLHQKCYVVHLIDWLFSGFQDNAKSLEKWMEGAD